MAAVGTRKSLNQITLLKYFSCEVFIVIIISLGYKSECSPVLSVERREQNVRLEGSEKEPLSSNMATAGNEPDKALSESPLVEVPKQPYEATDPIPSFYKVLVELDLKSRTLDSELIEKLKKSFSQQLDLPLKNIGVSHVKPDEGVVELYCVYVMANDLRDNQIKEDLAVLLPASEVARLISRIRLERDVRPVRVVKIEAKGTKEPSLKLRSSHDDIRIWTLFRNHIWSSWQLPLIISSSLLAVFAFSLLMVFICYRRELMKKSRLTNSDCVNDIRHIVYQPVMKPRVKHADTIQPENRDSYLTETESEQSPSPVRSPLKVKAKGLLERRGSNASLTLDLNRSQENLHTACHRKQCTAEEILISAGNRMTRRQLRNCLKDVKALHTEFWEIPMNHPEKVEIAGSGTKNRYKTILPNESTRVLLGNCNDDALDHYINANYIRGYDGEPRAYVATQGPMAHTVDDFWRMVWNNRSPIIIMITKLKEKNKVKCEPYVPIHSDWYGDVQVTVTKMVHRDGYTIRELFLKYGEEAHQVLHFWYTAWPDHKTPSTAKQLLAMALEVEALRHNNNGGVKGPVVVHCSAGIGRTGCFIATSIGIQQLLEESMVDILGIVCSLRLDRGGMVQTAEQYEFVHQALSLFERSLPEQNGE